MNAKTLFTYCLLACSVLAGAEALAGPALSSQSQSTVNSIEFSFMNYSSTLAPYVSSSLSPSSSSAPAPISSNTPPSAFNTPSPSVELAAPPIPVAAPAPQDIQPVTEIFVPSTAGQPTAPQVIETAGPPVVAAAVVPEPGTLALLGLGITLLILRRREGFHG